MTAPSATDAQQPWVFNSGYLRRLPRTGPHCLGCEEELADIRSMTNEKGDFND